VLLFNIPLGVTEHSAFERQKRNCSNKDLKSSTRTLEPVFDQQLVSPEVPALRAAWALQHVRMCLFNTRVASCTALPRYCFFRCYLVQSLNAEENKVRVLTPTDLAPACNLLRILFTQLSELVRSYNLINCTICLSISVEFIELYTDADKAYP